jgi:hypothetical protein
MDPNTVLCFFPLTMPTDMTWVTLRGGRMPPSARATVLPNKLEVPLVSLSKVSLDLLARRVFLCRAAIRSPHSAAAISLRVPILRRTTPLWLAAVVIPRRATPLRLAAAGIPHRSSRPRHAPYHQEMVIAG